MAFHVQFRGGTFQIKDSKRFFQLLKLTKKKGAKENAPGKFFFIIKKIIKDGKSSLVMF